MGRFAGPIQPNREHQGIPVTPQQDSELRKFFRFDDGGNIYLYPLAAQAKMGEALASVSLASFFTRANLPVKAIQSRFLTWENMRQQNVILLGHVDSNQWVEPVLRRAPFILMPTDQQHRARIRNASPREGEQSDYLPTLPNETKSYALVSMLPGVDGSHQILVIGGLDTSSTTAAAEYLTGRDTVSELLKQLRAAAPDHRGPWRFQAVLDLRLNDDEPGAQTNDTNYVFLEFVLKFLPAGLVGLVLAALFAASMNSTSAELSALTSTTVVDVLRRLPGHVSDERSDVWTSRVVTVVWAAFAVGFAQWASGLGTLVEAVNILGSLFYGTILGIFLCAFYLKRVGGHAVFAGALVAEAVVVACFTSTKISFLWYNLIGCALVMIVATALSVVWPRRESGDAATA